MINRIPQKEMRRFAAFASLGMEMVAPTALGLALDTWVGTGPWGVVVGAVLGFTVFFTHLLVLLNRFEEQDKAEPNRPPPSEKS